MTRCDLFALGLFLVPACSAGPTPAVDAGTRDTPPTDADVADSASVDGGSADASIVDAGAAADASRLDGGAAIDAGRADAGASADAGSAIDGGATCDYLDLDIWIVSCGGRNLYARRFTVPSGATAACPDYFTLGSTRFDTLADALASQTCQTDCLRAASTSVTLLRCGRRTGYIVFRDAEGSCPDVYETPDGLFGSAAEWDAAFPCP